MYQPIISIKDKRFSIYRLNQYGLFLSIGNNKIRITAIDQQTHRCVLLEAYYINSSTSEEYLSIVKQLFHDHPFIASSIWQKVVLSLENQKYTLVPSALFQEKYVADYLKLAVSIEEQAIHYCKHKDLGVTVIFAADRNIINWLQAGFRMEHCHVIHQANSLIASVTAYLYAHKLESPTVFVLAETEHMHITVVEKYQLLYYNKFAYHSSDEFLQYILIVMYTLALNPGTHTVVLAGNIAKGSLAYRKICNYIRYVSFSKEPPYLKFSWAFKKEVISNYFEILGFYPATDYLNKLSFL